MSRNWIYLTIIGVLFAGCMNAENEAPPFKHKITDSVKPWSEKKFDADENKFTFAVFSDLTGGERRDVFNVAVEQMNLFRPELIMNVGDLIEGGTQKPDSLVEEWQYFDERVSRLIAPVFYTGGNHDLTGPTLREVWKKRYGQTYYYFVYKDVLFMVLDTEDLGPAKMKELYEAREEAMYYYEHAPDSLKYTKYMSMPERVTGGISTEQSHYFQNAVAENPDVRWTFLFMHKPVWKDSTETDYAALEKALSGRNYTVFNGHLHTFSHTLKNGMDHMTLGTTGGTPIGDDPNSFDHITLVTVDQGDPAISHIRMDGILDETGHIPLNGDSLCFRADRVTCNDE